MQLFLTFSFVDFGRYQIYVNTFMRRWELVAVIFSDLMMVMWLVILTVMNFSILVELLCYGD